MAARVAIITPYWQEPRAILDRCIASVAAQSVPADHLLVADGAPQDWLDDAPVRHLRLDRNHADFGNVARAVGALLAAGDGYDAIGFLDADNRIDHDHVALCLAAAQVAGSDGVIAQRRFELSDGTPVPASDDAAMVDTNCLFLLPGAYPLIARWALIPPQLAPIGDRLFHVSMQLAGCRMARTDRPSVTCVSRWESHYAALGLPIPEDARVLDWAAIADWLAGLSADKRRTVEHLIGAALTVVEKDEGDEG
ncbi:MAG: glycosyltransferase family 2 protein [Erythrobacter sp.]